MPRALEGAMTDAGLLAGRLLLVFIFLHEGWSILGNYAGAAAYMQKFGMPSLLLPLVIALQLGGGALIAAEIHHAFRGAPVCGVLCVSRRSCSTGSSPIAISCCISRRIWPLRAAFLVLACCGPGNWSIGRDLMRSGN